MRWALKVRAENRNSRTVSGVISSTQAPAGGGGQGWQGRRRRYPRPRLLVDDVLFFFDTHRVALPNPVTDGDEYQFPGLTGFLRDRQDLALAHRRLPDGEGLDEFGPGPGEHAPRQGDGGEEAAALGVAVVVDLGAGGLGQEVEPVPKRGQGVALGHGGPVQIQHGGRGLGRKFGNGLFPDLPGPDPIGQGLALIAHDEISTGPATTPVSRKRPISASLSPRSRPRISSVCSPSSGARRGGSRVKALKSRGEPGTR